MLVSEYVTRNVNKLINSTKRAAREVIKGEDPEAVHDTRVGIRRIRAVLREVKDIFDKYYVNEVRKGFKNVFNKMGPVRDMEVANQLLEKVNISDTNKAGFNKWLKKRKQIEDDLRKDAIKVIQNKELDEPFKQLNAILTLPIKSKKDKPVEIYSFKNVNKIREKVLKMGESVLKNLDNAELPHDLRILCKRLRYNIDFFKPVLPKTFPSIMKYAKKMQSTLGDMHDRDVLLEMISSSMDLEDTVKAELIDILTQERQELAQKAEELTRKLPDYI